MKSSKGITLVAVAVTVIVLLILASISISIVSGDNGVILRSKEANSEVVISNEKKVIGLSVIAVRNSRNGQIKTKELDDEINRSMPVNVTKMGKYWNIQFIDTNHEYLVDIYGEILDSEQKKKVILLGEGDESVPYQIRKIEDLVVFAKSVKAGKTYENEYVILTTDLDFNDDNSYIDPNAMTYIDLNGDTQYYGDCDGDGNNDTVKDYCTKGNGFCMIGDNNHEFKGTVLGNNKKISNIYINTIIPSDEYYNYAGFFAISTGVIRDLELQGEMTVNYTAELELGGIVGRLLGPGEMNNCVNRINITASSTSNKQVTVGGIVGASLSTWTNDKEKNIIECTNYGDIYVESDYNIVIGGVCGSQSGDTYAEKLANHGNISGIGRLRRCDVQVGGVVGKDNYGIINKAFNTGKILGKTGEGTSGYIGILYCGGILASGDTYLYNSYNTGEVEARCINYRVQNAGGIAGEVGTKISNCYNTGKIFGFSYCGGVVGGLDDYSFNLYNVGECINGISYKLENSSSKHRNLYYLDSKSTKGVSYLLNVEDTTESKTDTYMQSQEFVDLLNANVDEENENSPKVPLEKWKKGTTYPVFEYQN